MAMPSSKSILLTTILPAGSIRPSQIVIAATVDSADHVYLADTLSTCYDEVISVNIHLYSIGNNDKHIW